jgi:hypothetical protein
MWMTQEDIESEGSPFQDAQGGRADFHSPRGTLKTHMAGKIDLQVPSIMSNIET